MHRQGGTSVLGAGTAGARAGRTSVGTGVAQSTGRNDMKGGRSAEEAAQARGLRWSLSCFPHLMGREGAEQRNDMIGITFCACVCLVNI